MYDSLFFFFFQAEDGIRDYKVTGVQTCALPISIASRYSSLYHSITCAVLSELIAGVLPSASITLAPYDHATDQKVEWASAQWLIAIPTGFPCLLRIRPDFRSSSHVFGVSSPAFLKWAML